MNATTKPVGVLLSLQWEPTTDYLLDSEVGDAIASYCTDAGIECPDDELFQCAAWAIPVGTALEAPEWLEFARSKKSAAPALRVTLAGTVFVLLVGWSGRCGCPECGSAPALSVLEVSR